MYSRKFQIAVEKKFVLSFDLPCATVMTKLKLQAQALSCGSKNVPCQTNFRDKLPFVNSMKSLVFDSTKILLPRRLVLTYSLMVKVMHYQILFTELKSSY